MEYGKIKPWIKARGGILVGDKALENVLEIQKG